MVKGEQSDDEADFFASFLSSGSLRGLAVY